MATATREPAFLVRQGEPDVLGIKGPPNEAEIRKAIELRCELWPKDNPTDKLIAAIGDYGDFMHSPAYNVLQSPDEPIEPGQEGASDLWADLRPSEARDLERYYQDALETALTACEAAIADAFTAAALRFAKLHPDAPRAQVTAK